MARKSGSCIWLLLMISSLFLVYSGFFITRLVHGYQIYKTRHATYAYIYAHQALHAYARVYVAQEKNNKKTIDLTCHVPTWPTDGPYRWSGQIQIVGNPKNGYTITTHLNNKDPIIEHIG